MTAFAELDAQNHSTCQRLDKADAPTPGINPLEPSSGTWKHTMDAR
jgi:hypothetical protein